jgi:hypothetical protein
MFEISVLGSEVRAVEDWVVRVDKLEVGAE